MPKIAKKTFLIGFVVVLATVSLVFVLSLPYQTPSEIPSDSKNLGSVIVLAIGESSDLFKEVIDALKSYGAQVTSLNELPNSTQGFEEGMIVIFDGEWLEGRVNDQELHAFFKDVMPRRIKLVAVGGATSRFFEALDKAGVYEIPVTETGQVRNPAYDNPSLAGLTMKKAYLSSGYEYLYPSVLCSATNDISTLVEALIGW